MFTAFSAFGTNVPVSSFGTTIVEPHNNGDEVVMMIKPTCHHTYISRAQAMEFFGLVDKPVEYITDMPKTIPECTCCGTTKNLHRDYGSGGPYRCSSNNCIVF